MIYVMESFQEVEDFAIYGVENKNIKLKSPWCMDDF